MNSKWDTLLKKVSCQKCHTKQPFFRIPKSLSELIFGGFTCKTCGTITDKYGNEYALKRVKR